MATEKSFTFNHNGQSVKIDYWSNGFDITKPAPNIDNVVIWQHGISGNADDYADYAIRSAQEAGLKAGTYAAITVEFDTHTAKEGDNPYWNGTSWKFGDQSLSASPGPQVSSFDVMNAVSAQLAKVLDADAEVVFGGHSAGGQFMARYAAGAKTDALGAKGIDHSFVIANPSSYMWFNGSADYPYGPNDLNKYMSGVGLSKLKENFDERDVTVFVGTKDTGTGDLDMSRAAMAQGDNRLERAENFYDHIKDMFNSPSHDIVYAQGVGHSGSGMARSDEGEDLLWNYDFS